MRPFLLVAALLGAASALASVADPLAHFRELAETRNYTLGRPTGARLTPDGRTLVFLRAAAREPVLRLYELDVASGEERELLTPADLLGDGNETLSDEEKARRERMRQSLRGFTWFQLSQDGARLLVSLSGRLYVVERASRRATALPGSGWIDPRLSPEGTWVAAAGADRELHAIDLAAPQPVWRALTRGASDTRSFGRAEFVAQEEMSRQRGFWWSPDSRSLLVQETDESAVEARWVADPLHPERAPLKFFYPRAGTPNAIVRLHLVPREGGTPRAVEWDRDAFPYLAHVNWGRSGPLTLLVQNRTQTEQHLLQVDPGTGRTSLLLRETDAAWLNLADNGAGSSAERRPPFWLEDGRRFLWLTEARGSWQLELRGADGRLLQELTPRDFRLEDLVGVDEKGDQVHVRGGPDPREIHVWSFPLTGGPGRVLSQGRGLHQAAFSAPSRRWVWTTDIFEGVHATEVRDADGRTLAVARSLAAVPPWLPRTELTRTQGERPLDAALTRPRTFEAGRRYPVILQVYAGPTSKRVRADARGYFSDQWMADQGYVVVRLDGRGTPGHGRDWERVIKGNLIDIALEDQVAGLQDLGRQFPELDLTRVGVTGWSFGGYFAAMAAARRPDVFRCAVAGAPVITWENYDTHYTERYLGLPQDQPEAYRRSNVTTYAAQLSRPLLLVHGITDDNVYFQHTLQLADALFLAGKPYELLPMLGTHMVSDPTVRLRQQSRIIEFFHRELKANP